MARGIVRSSLNDDHGSKYTNRIRAALEARGFKREGRTASFEVRGADLSGVIEAVKEALDVIDKLPPEVGLDHVWVYLDLAD